MHEVVGEHVFPFLRTLGGDGSTYAHHMRDARFTIPTPALLARLVDMIDRVPMEDRDTKGDLYEYMLGKIATARQNGQFRTPRHITKVASTKAGIYTKYVVYDWYAAWVRRVLCLLQRALSSARRHAAYRTCAVSGAITAPSSPTMLRFGASARWHWPRASWTITNPHCGSWPGADWV